MNTRYLAACAMVAALGASPVAYSAPGGGTEVIQYKTMHDGASGSSYVYDGSYYVYQWFGADVYDDPNGTPTGSVSTYFYRYHPYWGWWDWGQISCSGDTFANILSVGKGSKREVVLQATLDPADANCGAWGSVYGPVTIDVTGQANGNYASSSTGVSTETYPGQTYKNNYKNENFSVTFSGTAGFGSGPYDGSAGSDRNTQRTRVK